MPNRLSCGPANISTCKTGTIGPREGQIFYSECPCDSRITKFADRNNGFGSAQRCRSHGPGQRFHDWIGPPKAVCLMCQGRWFTVMSASKRMQRWLVATLAASSLAGGPQAWADTPEPIQRLGRFFGAGWGDGYHACETSGFRPLANLPPASFYQRDGKHHWGAGSHPIGGAGLESAIGKFYGEFGSCGSSGCDAHGYGSCDALACDSLGPAFSSGAGCDRGPDQIEDWNFPPSSILDRAFSLEKPSLTPDAGDRRIIPSEPASPMRPAFPGEDLPAPASGRPVEFPASPSDGASAAERSAGAPRLAANLHESQMRPIRPLPPQPRRQLSHPGRIDPPSTGPQTIDQQWPAMAPAMNTPDQDRNTAAHRVESTDRVAEVPDWLIIRQPTR